MKDYLAGAPKELQDEMQGAMNYISLANMAESQGDHGNAALLRDMAREEYCHAKHWKKMVHEQEGMTPPANHAAMVQMWENLEKQMKEL